MKKNILFVFLSAVILAGCIPGSKQAVEYDAASVTEVLEGVVSVGASEGSYSLRTSSGQVVLMHDGNTALGGYVGKSVQVTGQYSGSTLYVDEVVVK